MRNFVIDMMFMVNGPGTPDEKGARLSKALTDIREVTASGFFASDCLVTWAKSLGFFEDAKFIASVNGLQTEDAALNRALFGTVWRKHVLTWAAHHCMGVEGDFVEVGCHAGNTVKMIMDYTDFAGSAKSYWMYDLFEDDGHQRTRLPTLTQALYEQTVSRFAPFENVHIVKGSVPDSFAQGAPDKIALMHLDMNNAPAERAALEALFERVTPGGLVVFDDYGWVQYRPTKDGADSFMAGHGKKVLELPTGQGLVIK